MSDVSKSYEAPDGDKPLLPDWVCQECGGGLDPKVCYWDGDKRVCADCWDTDRTVNKVALDNAVEPHEINGKKIPLLRWQDGSTIHLMPHEIDGGQDPVQHLRNWLRNWVECCTADMQTMCDFGWQCWQDQCEGAYVETSVHKRVAAERDAANQRAERAEAQAAGYFQDLQQAVKRVRELTEALGAAEDFIASTPCDADTTDKQIEAHARWQEKRREAGLS